MIPLADSIIYATARRYHAELWTHDAHFRGLPGVRFVEPPGDPNEALRGRGRDRGLNERLLEERGADRGRDESP